MSVKTMYKHLSGLPNIPEINYFTLEENGEILFLKHIKPGFTKVETLQTYEIPFERVIELEFIDEEYLQNKSVVKRAIVGSLMGPLGTVIGGMSGIGKKTKIKKLYGITFLNSSDEIKTIVFDPNPIAGGLSLAETFHKKLMKSVALVDKTEKVKEIMNGNIEQLNISENEDGSTVVKL